MLKSIIKEIHTDNQCISEQIVLSERYKKISDEALKFYNQLSALLNDDQKIIFEKYVDSEMGICAEGELLHFKEGVKVGLLLAMECLS